MTICEAMRPGTAGGVQQLETAEAIRQALASGVTDLGSLLDQALKLLDRHEAGMYALDLPGSCKSVPVVDAAAACQLLEKSIPLRVRMLQLSIHQDECTEDLLKISVALAAVRDHILRSSI